ncbi:hypothetical protein [Saccharothrix sp. ST-888]|uniref:hypothetical protein n=1 Tax=Saccharothrix sp. ST-888 TaxID=1427391 RepID=UPI0005EC70A3|nr:hypothetical protein [Saccharothrix sp. ST-888]KJK59544.1 hypothetical protein UK12_03890 [Saccharothrix sp. ST-888]
MSVHAKSNYRPRPRVLAVATGVALLLGGGFAAQAVAHSGVQPAPAAPKVTTTGDAAPQVVSTPDGSKPAGAPKVVEAGRPAEVVKPGAGSAPAENAPRVIQPGSGVKK